MDKVYQDLLDDCRRLKGDDASEAELRIIQRVEEIDRLLGKEGAPPPPKRKKVSPVATGISPQKFHEGEDTFIAKACAIFIGIVLGLIFTASIAILFIKFPVMSPFTVMLILGGVVMWLLGGTMGSGKGVQ